MDYPKLKQLAREKNVTIKELAAVCNMTDAGLHKAIKEDTLRVTHLEKCADHLGVSVCAFFECGSNEVGEGEQATYGDRKYTKLLERCNELLEENIQLRSRLRKFES